MDSPCLLSLLIHSWSILSSLRAAMLILVNYLFTPRTCTRIGCVCLLPVSTKITRSEYLGIWVTHNHNMSIENVENLLYYASNHSVSPTRVANAMVCCYHYCTAGHMLSDLLMRTTWHNKDRQQGSCYIMDGSCKMHSAQWRIQRGIQGCTGTPLWAAPSTKKYTEVRLNGTPLSGYRNRKLLLWLLRML